MFENRREAGRLLADALENDRLPNGIVLALPRGGVVIGKEIADQFHLTLDVFITRKIGAPGNPEYAIGAVAETGDVYLNEAEIRRYSIPQTYIAETVNREREEIARRIDVYRDGRPLPSLEQRGVYLVDDGIATGFTILAAIRGIHRLGASQLVVAVPVAPPETVEYLEPQVDRVVTLATPEPFYAVGAYYREFSQLDDHDVVALLRGAAERYGSEETNRRYAE